MAVDDSYTKSLLHFDGDDASTTFTDESGKTWTAYGDAQLDTTQKKLGTASGLFDGTGDYISTPDHDDWNFGSGNFTIDLWLYLNSLSGVQIPIGQRSDINNRWNLYFSFPSQGLGFYWKPTESYLFQGSSAGWSANTWYHVAVVRNGDEFKLYRDGVAVATQSLSGSLPDITDGALYIGGTADGMFSGQIDEVRISKGIARWTSNFTPPTSAYGTSSTQYEETIEESINFAEDFRYYAEVIDESLVIADRLPYDEATVEETIDFSESFISVYEGNISESLDLADSDVRVWWEKTIEESLAIADITTPAWAKSITETLFIYDESIPSWLKFVNESLVLTDSQMVILGILISDWIKLMDSQTNNWYGTEVVPTELLNLYDLSKYSFLKTIAESLGIADAIHAYLCLQIPDVLTIKDAETNNWHGTEVVPTELLRLYDLPAGTKVINRSIAEALNMADTSAIQWVIRVLEYLRFTDLLTAIGTFNHSAADSLGLTDEASRAFDQLIAETLSIIDLSAIITTFTPSIAESLGLADTSTPARSVGKVISDAIGLADSVGSNLHGYAIVQDAIALNVTVEMNGDVYECYVLNTPKFLPSVYSGFDFNSYCTFEGKAYGANSVGIYELGGETDAGAAINTGVVLSQTTFGIPNQKKLRRAWLGVTGTTPTLVLEVEDGTRKAYTIDSYGEVGSDREVRGKTWKLSVINFDELDFIKILPVALAR